MRAFRKSTKCISMKYTSVEDIDDLETGDIINSPRSIEACLREGISTKDLIYIPESQFSFNSYPNSLKSLHYEFYEARRRELLFNVRKTRKELISKQHSVSLETSSSTPHLPHFLSSSNKRQRVKQVQAKFIKEKCSREELVKKDLVLKDIETSMKTQKIADLNEIIAKSVKNRIDKEFRFKEERKKKEQIEEENLIERQIEFFDKDAHERIRVNKILKQREKEILKKKKLNDEKAKEFCERMIEKDEEVLKNKIKEIEEKNIENEKRVEGLLIEKLRKQKEMEKLWDRKILKSKKVKEEIRKNIEEIQNNYYEMKKIFDMNFQERLRKLDDRPKSLESIHGNIPRVTQAIINENIFMRETLEDKLEVDKEKVEKVKMFKIRKLKYEKQIKSLKAMKKDWNLNRIKNKQEYSKTLSNLKFAEINKKLENFELNKTLDLEKTMKIHIEDEMKSYTLANEVEKMSIFKRWSEDKLLKIINYES